MCITVKINWFSEEITQIGDTLADARRKRSTTLQQQQI